MIISSARDEVYAAPVASEPALSKEFPPGAGIVFAVLLGAMIWGLIGTLAIWVIGV